MRVPMHQRKKKRMDSCMPFQVKLHLQITISFSLQVTSKLGYFIRRKRPFNTSNKLTVFIMKMVFNDVFCSYFNNIFLYNTHDHCRSIPDSTSQLFNPSAATEPIYMVMTPYVFFFFFYFILFIFFFLFKAGEWEKGKS
jgi:hypothetical protein